MNGVALEGKYVFLKDNCLVDLITICLCLDAFLWLAVCVFNSYQDSSRKIALLLWKSYKSQLKLIDSERHYFDI